MQDVKNADPGSEPAAAEAGQEAAQPAAAQGGAAPDPVAGESHAAAPAPDGPDAGAPVAGEGEPTTEAFAALLEPGGGETGPRWKRGDKIRARVVSVSADYVFVSLGGKHEGTIRRDEFAAGGDAEAGSGTEAGSPTGVPSEGDEVEAFVLSTAGGEVTLTTRLGRRDASLEELERAWQDRIPVEGRVAKSVKGGFEVRIAGARAFCPLSQIDVRWPKEPDVHVGQTYAFRVADFKERGRNIIVSRRVLLEEERALQREQLKASVTPGAVVTGVVRSLQSFGAFVDLGGVDALIPISEMSWTRVEEPSAVLSEGQQVTAQVIGADWERDRVSLSLKALAGDPWSAVAQRFRAGARVTGTVARLAPFGAFVTLEPGVDGLVHISALGAGRRVAHPKEVLQVGEQVEVEVLSVDPEKRRISLSLEHRVADALGDLPRVGAVLEGSVESVAAFGVFVKLPSGHTGLAPNAELGTPRGSDHAKMFRKGSAMEVLVLAVEEGGRRIRLSRKGVQEQAEDEDVRKYAAAQSADEGASFGTLGDLLKAKLNRQD